MLLKERIRKLYKTPGHPIAFSSPGNIFRYFRGKISENTIRSALEEIDSYTLHREYKQPKFYNPHYVYRRRKQFQADLIDIASLKKDNNGVTFLLLVIDTFSRKIWVMPLMRKTADETRNGLKLWLSSLRNELHSPLPESILTDSGKEFLNTKVMNLMKDQNIRMDRAKNINKAAIAERVNKSLQILIYKYLTDRGETRYLDVLPLLVQTYNNRKHRTLNYMTPNQADKKENASKIRTIHSIRYGKLLTRKGNVKRRRTNRFQIGNVVRVKTYALAPSSSRRAYLQQFHGELFKIVKVNERMPITMYEIESMNTLEHVEGGFYDNELTRIQGEAFKIEKILQKRGSRKNEEYLVRWKHFSPEWDSWIKSSDVITV